MQLKDIFPTDLIAYQIKPREGTKVYNAKHKKLSQDCKWWLQHIIEEKMDTRMYERTVTTNSSSFRWNANLLLIFKPGQVQPCLIFNYHFIYKDIPASYIEAATIMHDLLSISSYQYLFLADIKHRYWAVNIHPNNRHYLAFHIPGIDQV